ncbi:MAG: Lrp/AsnC family transcriptional regulator [Sphingomonadales bacterium]
MDSFDRRILAYLQRDCRASLADIAADVGLSASACHKRIKAIEARGLIDAYSAIIDEEAVGLRTHIFAQVTLKSQHEAVLTEFETAVQRHGDIMECYLMAGTSDYLLRIVCRDVEDYERIHKQILTRLPGVDRLMSNFAIRKIFRRSNVPLPRAAD